MSVSRSLTLPFPVSSLLDHSADQNIHIHSFIPPSPSSLLQPMSCNDNYPGISRCRSNKRSTPRLLLPILVLLTYTTFTSPPTPMMNGRTSNIVIERSRCIGTNTESLSGSQDTYIADRSCMCSVQCSFQMCAS